MVYNASNKMTQFTATGVSVAYRYDAKERRVRQDSGGQTTIWVYDAFGQLAAEYPTNLTMTQGVYYRTNDHLGSTRIVTNQSATVVQRRDFFPFGEAIPADSSHGNRQAVTDGGQATYITSSGVKQQFTGQQRDGDTGLDYFLARYYSAPLGRFLSVDPGGAGAHAAWPQSLNAFVYVENRPLILFDPTGLQAEGPPRDPTSYCQLYPYNPACPLGDASDPEDPYPQAPDPLPVSDEYMDGWLEDHDPEIYLASIPLGSLARALAKWGTRMGPRLRQVSQVAKLVGALGLGFATRAVQALITKVPSDWIVKLARNGRGLRIHPDVGIPSHFIRIMKASPNGQPAQQVDYVKVLYNGRFLDQFGNPILTGNPGDTAAAHIPLDVWLSWSYWFHP
jgi:RHS repeat-associated protein